jgi:hypothetical protein
VHVSDASCLSAHTAGRHRLGNGFTGQRVHGYATKALSG